MSGEQLLSHTRSLLWRAWANSQEEIASEAASTLLGLGMLVPEGGAAELARLRLLFNAAPAELSVEQTEALAEAASRSVEDSCHQHMCACSLWPDACPSYKRGQLDNADQYTDALPAIIGLWEAFRASADADELGRLRTERQSTNDALAAGDVEREGLLKRIAELDAAATAEATVYRAWYEPDGLSLGLYTSEKAAQAHCDELLRRENTGRTWDWAPDDEGDLVQVFVSKLSDRPEQTTGYLVTSVTVAAEYDAEADE